MARFITTEFKRKAVVTALTKYQNILGVYIHLKWQIPEHYKWLTFDYCEHFQKLNRRNINYYQGTTKLSSNLRLCRRGNIHLYSSWPTMFIIIFLDTNVWVIDSWLKHSGSKKAKIAEDYGLLWKSILILKKSKCCQIFHLEFSSKPIISSQRNRFDSCRF